MRDEANEECSGCEERWCWGEEVMRAMWHGVGEGEGVGSELEVLSGVMGGSFSPLVFN